MNEAKVGGLVSSSVSWWADHSSGGFLADAWVEKACGSPVVCWLRFALHAGPDQKVRLGGGGGTAAFGGLGGDDQCGQRADVSGLRQRLHGDEPPGFLSDWAHSSPNRNDTMIRALRFSPAVSLLVRF